MMRRAHRIVFLLALLIGGVGMNYVQAANAQIIVKTIPSGYGTVKAGSSSYQATVTVSAVVGGKLTLYAKPNTGYKFVKWEDNSTAATRTVTVPNAKTTTYTATFAVATYTLTVTSNNTNYGTVTGGGTYNYNTSVTLTATPKTGYHFVQWSDGDTNASRTVTATANASYQATFAVNTYTLTVSSNNTNYGTVTGGGTYNHSAKATLTATPKTGYHFVQWNDGNTNASRSVTVTAAATYTATFAVNQYTLTVKTATGNVTQGTVKIGSGTAGASASATINHGTKATITATPKAGYHFVQWNDNNTTASREVTVTAAKTYTATFAINTYTITFKNGSTTLQSLTVNYGVTPSYTGSTPTKSATAEYTYTFSGWSPTVVAATANATYTAQFTSTKRSYKITGASANTAMGTVSGTATKQYNQTVTLIATPKSCYKFVQWNDGNTSNPRTVTVQGTATYTATFEETINGTCGANGDNVKWYLNECTGALRIVGSGAMADYTSSNPGWYSYRSSITSVTIASGVTSIGAYAFWNHTALTSVVIPSTVTSIGKRAFGNCNLSSLTIPNGVTSIQEGLCYHCSSLTSVTIPNSVTDIGNNTFYATSLASVTIPNAVTSIGSYAFSTNNAITDIYVSWTTASAIPIWSSMTNKTASEITLHIPCGSGNLYRAANGWKNYTIRGDTQYTLTAKTPGSGYGTVSIDDGTAGASVSQKIYCETDHILTPTRTGCYYFTQWSDGNTDNPRTVRINSNATYNAQFSNSFSGTCGAAGNEANVQWSLNTCTGVLSITGTGDMMNYSSTNQPWYPYRESITSVTIANGVTRIGNYAFYYYPNLASVTIPPSITSIGNYAFYQCYAMESLYITDLAAWCNISFGASSASPFSRNDFTDHIGGGNLYVNGTKVTTLTIPNGITEIPNYAFFGFAGVTSIQFNQVTTIGSYAFAACHGLSNVTIPEGVTTIGNNAFAFCTHLQSMSIPASAMSIGIEMMYNCHAQTDIYVHWTENIPNWPSSFTTKAPQTDITLHVPTCMHTQYTGGWANYTIDGETEERAVSIASNNATYGLVQYNDETPVVSIDKQVSCITSFTVTAIPAEGCHFVEWSDGLLQGTRQLRNLESDTALTALFGPGVPPEIYDDQVGFTQQGALSGAFSVSATQVVYFSQGPLQFNASLGTHECADGTTKPGTWRFAEHQYDVVGDLNAGNVYENGVKCSNTLASATYTGWQDMYCWGASGYNGIEPYKANRPSTTSIAGTNYDWGVYNAISNGGNTPGLWRTPTRAEWNYMFTQRPNALELNAPAVVEGMYGLVVLPDDWVPPAGLSLVTNSTQYYTDNVFTAAQWQEMENAGAVFIPSGGWFSWNSSMWISYFRNTGELWASTGSSTSSQHDVQWGNDRQAYLSASSNHVLEQLRLVSDVGGYTKVRFVGIDSHGDKFVIAYIYVPYGATPVPPEVPERECYTFTGWDRTISPANGHVTTYTAQYETDLFTVTVQAADPTMGDVNIVVN